MLTAFYYGLIASCALLGGGIAGALWRPSRTLTGILLAFASGTLIAALAFELFPAAMAAGGFFRASLGMLIGAASFVLLNQWIDVDRALKRATGESSGEVNTAPRNVGLALLAAVTLDGIPENMALGISLQGHASLTLLVAIFASNFPEALVGAAVMRNAGQDKYRIIIIWFSAALALTFMVMVGKVVGQLPPAWLGVMLAFAGGAVLASLADTIMPEAFERGNPLNSFATVLGFLLSFALSEHA